MSEVNKYINYLIGYEKFKSTVLSGIFGIISLFLSLMIFTELYTNFIDNNNQIRYIK